MLPQSPIEPHVLFMVHRVDDAARAKEQQCLEERMGKQMEHRAIECANPGRKEHITQLATR